MSAVKEWAFKDAQELVAAMRSKVNGFGYEVTVGGSVLTTGMSKNDLDLFFVPKDGTTTALPVDLLMWLASKLGAGKTIVPALPTGPAPPANNRAYVPPPPKDVFLHKMRFDLAGRKIDAFVI
jgi:hypothetical protein